MVPTHNMYTVTILLINIEFSAKSCNHRARLYSAHACAHYTLYRTSTIARTQRIIIIIVIIIIVVIVFVVGYYDIIIIVWPIPFGPAGPSRIHARHHAMTDRPRKSITTETTYAAEKT